jgi:formylglycine-generating enzyme required for sulfatase activity
VTRAQYAAFLLTNPVAQTVTGCTWNTSYTPDTTCMASTEVCKDTGAGECDDHPQPCVDWCDAYGYCLAQGKHLCGKIGMPDAMLPVDQFADAGISEWMNACSAGGENTWVHGNVWNADPQGQWCNGSAKAKGTNGMTYAGGALGTCQSPAATYKSIYDLGGNVSEWENSCSKIVTDLNASQDDVCRIRGGSYKSGKASLQCNADPQKPARSFVAPDIGFRCCGG